MKAATNQTNITIPTKKFSKLFGAKETMISLALFFAFVGVWELLSRLGIFHELILPAPSLVLSALVNLVGQSYFYLHLGVTLYETLAGFLIGCILAVILGIVVSSSTTVYKVLNPYIVIFQAVPKIALAPIFITWFGFGPSAKVVMAMAICFFPTFINTVVGLKSVDEESKLLFQSMVASKKDVFLKLSLPTALPNIFAGLKSSLTFALIGAIVGEFMGANEGLGLLLDTFNFQLDMASVYAVIIVLSLIGLVFYLIIEWLDKKLIFWGDQDKIL